MADECTKLRAEIVELEKKLKSTIEKKDSLKLMVSRVEVEEYELTSQLREKKQAFRVLAESSAPSPQQTPQGAGQQDSQQGQELLQQQQQQEPVQSVANQRMRGVLSNLKEFRGLVERLPRIPLNLGEARDRPEDEGLMPHRVVGPHDPYALTPPDVDVIGTRVAAKTISTYPMNTARTKRVSNATCN